MKFFYYHFGCAWPSMPKMPQITSLHVLTIPPKKHCGSSKLFSLQMNTKVFCKLMVFRMCPGRHDQCTQKNKFAIFLQCLKENVKDEVDFLPADKR